MPELIVSVFAAISGNTEIAIGNVLGSNIANIFLILGLTACIAPVALSRSTRFFDLPVSILVTLLLAIFVSDMFLDGTNMNIIGRIDAIVLLFLAVIFIGYSIRHNNFVPEDEDAVEETHSLSKAIFWAL